MALPLTLIDSDASTSDEDFSDISSVRRHSTITRQFDNGHISAVIVNTNRMMLRANVQQYVPYTLLPTDSIFPTRPASISEVSGVPLLACAVHAADSPHLAPFLRESQIPNLLVRRFFRECDVTSCDDSAGPYEWDHQFGQHKRFIDGPAIFARQDG